MPYTENILGISELIILIKAAKEIELEVTTLINLM